MTKVSIIGAGNVGATAAMNIAQMNFVDNVVLLDIKEGFAEGKAMDIMQCATARNFKTNVWGVTNDYSATAESDVIVITSGMPRKPGMTREDLVGINSRIMQSIVTECHKYSPDAIYVIVSNPMDTMTYHVQNILLKLGKEDVCTTVFGMGGMLDSSRFAYFIRKALCKHDINARPEDINAFVIGGHGDTTMIPLIEAAQYKDTYINDILTPEECEQVVADTMKGGATLTGLLGTSAWEAPAACIALTVKAIIDDENLMMPCSVYNTDYKCCIGTLVTIGANGVENFYMPEYEINLYQKIEASVAAVKKVNEALPEIN